MSVLKLRRPIQPIKRVCLGRYLVPEACVHHVCRDMASKVVDSFKLPQFVFEILLGGQLSHCGKSVFICNAQYHRTRFDCRTTDRVCFSDIDACERLLGSHAQDDAKVDLVMSGVRDASLCPKI